MPEDTPAAAPPATPATAPGLTELFEQSLMSLALAPSVFGAAALRPAPSFGAAAGLILASGAAALAVGLGTNQDFLQRFPPAMIAVMAAAALGIYASLLLLFAVLLYGLGRSLGGTGDFDRALQAAAAVSLLTPLQAICGGFPVVWALPPVAAAWVAAGALEKLFKADPVPVRAACALLAAAAIGLQFAGKLFIGRAGQAYALTQTASQAMRLNDELVRQMQAMPAPDAAGVTAPAATGTSGLDLLRGPEDDAPASPPVAAAPAAPAQDTAQLEQHASDMLTSLTPMLETAAASGKLSPQQKSDMKELQKLMKDLQEQMKPGAKRLSPAEEAKNMAQIQQMTMRMMSMSMQAAPPGPAKKGELK